RIALCRVHNGTIARGQQVAWCRRDGSTARVKISELYLTEALDRVPAQSAGPGDIIAVAGISDIMIGETLADAEDPRPLPLITVDEPAVSVTIGVNSSPLAGRDKGTKVTARLGRDRLVRELVGNGARRGAPGHLGGAGARRAGPGGAGRDDAPGGLRAHRGPAHRRHQGHRRRPA